MKRIKSYTLGWNTTQKEGYITLTDDSQKDHSFEKISLEEMALLQKMLYQDDAYLDEQQWLIVGWKKRD